MKAIIRALGLLLASPLVHAGVVVVDAGGGGDFTTLTAAVAAAADGDLLLVHNGDYVEPGLVVVEGKGLTVAGEWGADAFQLHVTVKPGLVVRNLPPGKHVVLQNLEITGAPSTSTDAAAPALAVQDNVAQVRVQNCALFGGFGNHNNFPDGSPAIVVEGTLSAAFVHCSSFGGGGQFSPDLSVKTGHGGAALLTGGGPVLVSHSHFRGGDGGGNIIGGWPDGGDGGAGLVHASGPLLLVSSVFTGGGGGVAHTGGDGGDGLVLGTSGAAALLAGTFSSGGQGGSSNAGPDGADGVALSDPLGLSTNYGGTEHDFHVTSPAREGQLATLDLGGQVGDSTLLFVSLNPHQVPFLGYQGVLVLSPTALIGPFPIGAPGNQNLSLVMPLLPAGLESLLVHVQPAYVGGDGVVLGAGQVLSLLDAAF